MRMFFSRFGMNWVSGDSHLEAQTESLLFFFSFSETRLRSDGEKKRQETQERGGGGKQVPFFFLEERSDFVSVNSQCTAR